METIPCRDLEYGVSGMEADDNLHHGSKLLICMVGLSGCGKTYDELMNYIKY